MIRHLLLATALVASLAACSSTTTPVTVQSVANDVNLIATGLNNALSQPSVVAVIPAATMTQIETALAELTKLSADVAAAPSATAAKGTVAVVEADVNAIVASLAGLPLPPPAPMILEAANIILPVVEVAIGIAAPASAASHAMNADVARMHLAAGK